MVAVAWTGQVRALLGALIAVDCTARASMKTQVERYCDLLSAGVVLSIPPREIPDRQTTGATLQWLGEDRFRRVDEHVPYEVGHDFWDSSVSLLLNGAQVNALLGAVLSSTPVGKIAAVAPQGSSGAHPFRTVIAELLGGQRTMSQWFSPPPFDAVNTAIGRGHYVLWIQTRASNGAVLFSKAISAATLESMGELTVDPSWVRPTTEEDRRLVERALATSAEEQLLLDQLSDTTLALGDHPAGQLLKRSDLLGWVGVSRIDSDQSLYLIQLSPGAERAVVRAKLSDNRGLQPVQLSPEMRIEIGQREERLFDLLSEWKQSRIALSAARSSPELFVWLDHRCYLVRCELQSKEPLAIEPHAAPDSLSVQWADVARGAGSATAITVDEEWIRRARALLGREANGSRG